MRAYEEAIKSRHFVFFLGKQSAVFINVCKKTTKREEELNEIKC